MKMPVTLQNQKQTNEIVQGGVEASLLTWLCLRTPSLTQLTGRSIISQVAKQNGCRYVWAHPLHQQH